jgi:hypothetical protein
MIVAMSYMRETGAIAFPLKERSPNASTSLAQTPIPSLTLPPAIFPTNQAPGVSVPPLQQAIPAETLPAVTPAQPPELPPANVSPTPNSSPVIEFGQPLPETTTSAEPALIPQSGIPTLEPAAAFMSQESTETDVNPEILLPSGTQLSLRYPGEKVLNLQAYQLRQEVLLLQEDLRDRNNQVIAPAGTPIIGYFETSSTGSRFIAKAIVLRGSNLPLKLNPIISKSLLLKKLPPTRVFANRVQQFSQVKFYKFSYSPIGVSQRLVIKVIRWLRNLLFLVVDQLCQVD